MSSEHIIRLTLGIVFALFLGAGAFFIVWVSPKPMAVEYAELLAAFVGGFSAVVFKVVQLLSGSSKQVAHRPSVPRPTAQATEHSVGPPA
jgi:hypothetical protein